MIRTAGMRAASTIAGACFLLIQTAFGLVDPSTLQKGAYTNLSYTTSDGKTLYYQIYVPATYKTSDRLPLFLWMHGGSSLSPGGLDSQYDALTLLKTNPNWNETTYPCAIVEPLCSPDWCGEPSFVPGYPCWDGFGWAYGTPAHVHNLNNPPVGIKYVCELVPILEKDLGLDSLRCYATGWSNGGYAAWDLIMLRPDLYAAALAISGAGDTSHAYRFFNIPVWAFHSGDDDVVPFSGSQTMIDKLTALGGTPKLTNTNGWKHFAYAPAFQTPELVPWLFSQNKKTSPSAVAAGRTERVSTSLRPARVSSIFLSSEGRLMIRAASGDVAPAALYDLHGRMRQPSGR
jgi:pimeloyl-ACP methyl ester carboxylesterase